MNGCIITHYFFTVASEDPVYSCYKIQILNMIFFETIFIYIAAEINTTAGAF